VILKPVSLPLLERLEIRIRMTSGKFNLIVERLVREVIPGTPVILLDSQMKNHPSSRYSIFATNPDVIIRANGLDITIIQDGNRSEKRMDPWEALKEVRGRYPGWYLGYFGYDLKNHIEDLKSNNRDYINAPDLYFFRPKNLLVYDHLECRLEINSGIDISSLNLEQPKCEETIIVENLQSVTPEESYLNRIYTAMERIRDGEFYEINLSHMIRGTISGSGFDLYKQMRTAGPVPFGAYMKLGEFEVCCSSPERFLSRDRGRVFSQPIKGTAPRNQSPAADREISDKLLKSEKNRAENLMIVDLVRHDLSKVAIPGTIRVPDLFQLQSFETVHQLISTIEGRVVPGTDSVEILKSCFPMGSMTGAPKIRAMQAIEELEDYKRGIYSGAIGYLKPDNDFDFNVVIRSAILKNGDLFYPAGGAITSDSDPEEELEETYVKTRALTMISGLNGHLK
jgi:para-aminobenzoate synthetase component I